MRAAVAANILLLNCGGCTTYILLIGMTQVKTKRSDF